MSKFLKQWYGILENSRDDRMRQALRITLAAPKTPVVTARLGQAVGKTEHVASCWEHAMLASFIATEPVAFCVEALHQKLNSPSLNLEASHE